MVETRAFYDYIGKKESHNNGLLPLRSRCVRYLHKPPSRVLPADTTLLRSSCSGEGAVIICGRRHLGQLPDHSQAQLTFCVTFCAGNITDSNRANEDGASVSSTSTPDLVSSSFSSSWHKTRSHLVFAEEIIASVESEAMMAQDDPFAKDANFSVGADGLVTVETCSPALWNGMPCGCS